MSAQHGVRRGGMISCAKRGVQKKDRGGKKKRRAVHAGHPTIKIERTGNVQRGFENADDKPERQRDEPQCSIALKGERGRHEQQQNAGNQAGEPPRESECRDRKKGQPRADGRTEVSYVLRKSCVASSVTCSATARANSTHAMPRPAVVAGYFHKARRRSGAS
jgi:hypothetical protein